MRVITRVATLCAIVAMAATAPLTAQQSATGVTEGVAGAAEGTAEEVIIEERRGLTRTRQLLTNDPDSIMYSTISINEDESARSALRPFEVREASESLNGYRVGVYFDNSSHARSGAESVMQRCDSLLGDIPATMTYDNPYFKVSVGYSTTEEEAVIMLNRVQRYFPKAYLLREMITVDDIIAARKRELERRELIAGMEWLEANESAKKSE